MARAKIKINGSDSTFTTVAIGSTVLLFNDDEGGEVTYAWTIVDQPEGTADVLSSSSVENPTFVPTKEGSYLIRLVVNASLGSQAIQTAKIAVPDARTGQIVPAATETVETSSSKGWALALNRILQQTLHDAADGNLQAAQTPGSISAGAIVKLSGIGTINTGSQSEFDCLQIASVNATTAVSGRLGILVDGVVSGDLGAGKLVIVRMIGLVPFAPSGSPAVGDPVYLSNTGTPALTAGTVPRTIGTVVAAGGGTYRWAILDNPTSAIPPPAGQFGDASDGSATMDGSATVPGFTRTGSTYVADREPYFQNLTVNVGITCKLDGKELSVRGLLTYNGIIDSSGGNATGTTGGLASSTGPRPLPVGTAGVNGSATGTPQTLCPRGFSTAAAAGGIGGTLIGGAPTPGADGGIGHGGGGGGGGANGGIGNGTVGGDSGGNTLSGPALGDVRQRAAATSGRNLGGSQYTCGCSGGGGAVGNPTGNGGGSGGAGGWIVIYAYQIAGTGVIRAKGGNGGDGDGGGGGGSGGPGGVVVVVTLSGAPTIDVSGGTPGAGGGGSIPSGQPGAAGGRGGDGIIMVMN